MHKRITWTIFSTITQLSFSSRSQQKQQIMLCFALFLPRADAE